MLCFSQDSTIFHSICIEFVWIISCMEVDHSYILMDQNEINVSLWSAQTTIYKESTARLQKSTEGTLTLVQDW